jgi:general secretion pathway protein N
VRAWLVVLFLVVAVAAAVAMAPLGAVLAWGGASRLGLSAAAAEGTIWSGRLVGARYGAVQLGDLDIRLDPLALLTGGLRLHSRAEAGAFTGRAEWMARGQEAGVEAVDGELTPNLLRTALSLPAPIRLEGVAVRFRQGRCATALGRVSASSEAGALTGALACRDGALLVPLQGKSVYGQTSLTIAIEGDGRYRAETKVSPTDPSVGAGLRLAGFTDAGGAMLRTDEGRLPLR